MGKKPDPKAKVTAAKSKPVNKFSAKVAAKNKAQASPKAKATADPDRQQLSGFVTAMKYKISQGQNRDQATTAQKLLEMYSTMDSDGKRQMARQYSEHGPKDLSWAATYLESDKHDSVTERCTTKGMRTRKQILELEGIDTDGMDEAAKQECLKELLDALWAWLKTDPTKDPDLVQDHKIPAMKKYYYEYLDPLKEKEVDTKSQSMTVKAEGFKMEAAKKMITSKPSDPNIKLENPWHVELMAKVKPVWTAKAKLDREETALKDTLCEFAVAVNGKPGFEKLVDDYEAKMGVLHNYLLQLRKAYAAVSKVTPSDQDECTKALVEWTTFGEQMLIHQEGVKQMNRGMKAFL
ncbi:unnamed protein product [Symbiodinium sp. CCMP2592]|nr:unnamed protein product [Symbiodinium sp. CCMP2592]